MDPQQASLSKKVIKESIIIVMAHACVKLIYVSRFQLKGVSTFGFGHC